MDRIATRIILVALLGAFLVSSCSGASDFSPTAPTEFVPPPPVTANTISVTSFRPNAETVFTGIMKGEFFGQYTLRKEDYNPVILYQDRGHDIMDRETTVGFYSCASRDGGATVIQSTCGGQGPALPPNGSFKTIVIFQDDAFNDYKDINGNLVRVKELVITSVVVMLVKGVLRPSLPPYDGIFFYEFPLSAVAPGKVMASTVVSVPPWRVERE